MEYKMMDFRTFVATARAAGMQVAVVDAHPAGTGWLDPRPLELIETFAREMVEDGDAVSVEEAIELTLETGLVIAGDDLNSDPQGAWSAAGWFLSNRRVSISDAYNRVFAG